MHNLLYPLYFLAKVNHLLLYMKYALHCKAYGMVLLYQSYLLLIYYNLQEYENYLYNTPYLLPLLLFQISFQTTKPRPPITIKQLRVNNIIGLFLKNAKL